VSSLMEVLVTMTLVCALALIGVGAARGQVDRMRVMAAREDVAGVFRAARIAARAHGGARIQVDPLGRVHLFTPQDSLLRSADPMRLGVQLTLAGSRTEAEFPFGPLGVARVASATLVLSRGSTEQHVVLSAQGRVRRTP
jgi:Tfp pilus assembly protein FimT